ncbi:MULTISPECIES: phage tail family protein [Paenarthrobacter]|uniref:Phage tail family protein n=1 Tax=Paenarthrobacter ureafaciens TaxID=37931 RepID=A0AAX3EFY3_PAEUR|nr:MULTISPECIES: phage tail family protein [Paenarthrobacter]MDO5866040.1 phage tail family protein [Paenarthrobacter sp. SD-2]MDO5877137.1 phage tail family protein [Paenarthrobacter sp. SD-1]UYV92338.1 phage tail family protein [Paenarthrobacter ureafaciens]UYV96873.1 phage tail family protein [Paenarthrobacter ureafaciens]WIV32237.1 phage tail family protein [Paenarthrobacter sp. R1]
MPYPSPITYPSRLLYPGTTEQEFNLSPIAIGDLLLNAIDENGSRWIVKRFDGWGGPGSTAVFTQRARGHGSTASEAFYEHRVMVIEGLILTESPELLSAALDLLSASVTLDQFTMIVSETGYIRHVLAQRQGEIFVNRFNNRQASFSIQVVAKDPRKFGDLITVSTPLPSSSGGRTYPATYPITYTGVSETGVVRLTNTGNTQAPVWLRVDGPIPAGGWTVTHIGKKQALTFATSLALTSGEFVTVDMDRREVLAQGQAARAGYVTSRGWFSLDPGDNDIAFSAAAYSATAQLTVTTKPSWS